MAKVAGAIICLLMVSMDVIAGILGIEAEIEQNKVKYLRLWIFECRAPSEQAFKLGLVAAILLGLAHVIANLSQVCLGSVLQEELRRASPRRKLSVALLNLNWIIFAVGWFMLVIGTLSNHKSKGSLRFQFHTLSFSVHWSKSVFCAQPVFCFILRFYHYSLVKFRLMGY